MPSHSVLAAILAIASLAISGAEARYGRINTYLVEKVTSDDAAANLKAASEWLALQSSTKQSFLSTTPISDLKLFTALQQVLEDTKCDRASYNIMVENEEAVGLHKLIRNREVIRRVDKVLLDIFKDHAKKCAKVYPLTYRVIKNQLDRELSKRALNVARTIMEKDMFMLPMNEKLFFYSPLSIFYRYIRNYPSIESLTYGVKSALVDALRSSAKNDPDVKYTRKVPNELTGKKVVHEDKIKELTKKYLVEPCQYIVDELGPNVFIPARFDVHVYFKTDEKEEEYYRGWANFMLCQAIVKNERAVYDNVVKIISD